MNVCVLNLLVPQLCELLCSGIVRAAHGLPQFKWVCHIIIHVVCHIHQTYKHRQIEL